MRGFVELLLFVLFFGLVIAAGLYGNQIDSYMIRNWNHPILKILITLLAVLFCIFLISLCFETECPVVP